MSDQSAIERQRAEKLAYRIGVLQDIRALDHGKPFTFAEVQAHVAKSGASLSPARWSYMVSGRGPWVTDGSLLIALADLFDVPPRFLFEVDSDELPPRVAEKMDQVREMREAEVKLMATRRLGPIDSGIVDAIDAYLRNRKSAR